MKSKGYRKVSIKGIEGLVEFDLERYEDGGDYFALSNQFRGHKESKLLQDWVLLQIQEKSYESVSRDIIALTGKKLVSSNELSEQVKDFAQKATQNTINSYRGTQLVIPFADALNEGIYDESIVEIRFFDDAIGVKKQKNVRESSYQKQQQRVQTDVIEIERKDGQFEYITAGYGVANWDIERSLSCWISKHYGNVALPIVAITDGAKNIRLRLWRLFGVHVTIILDWWHLQKKVRELMSMISFNKLQKQKDVSQISALLWEGKVNNVIQYIQTIVPRNKEKHTELLEYLQKHQSEIINYKKRKEAKKTIGSGRAEKGVDLIVAQRQKNKPIAWSVNGSRALAVLKADYLNAKLAA